MRGRRERKDSSNPEAHEPAEKLELNGRSIASLDVIDQSIKMVESVKPIFRKNPDQRFQNENKLLNRFAKNSKFFRAIVEHTCVEVSRSLLRFAQVHDVAKGRQIVTKGDEMQHIIVLLGGKFGIVESGEMQEIQKDQAYFLRKILENSEQISRELRRRSREIAASHSPYAEIKTTKASMYQLPVHRTVDNAELIFNLPSISQGRFYTESLFTHSAATVLTLDVRQFYEVVSSHVRNVKAEKISAFRGFEYFNGISNQRLIQIVNELPLRRALKGEYIYREGEKVTEIYLLIKGSVKITKTVELLVQNPNSFYMERAQLEEASLLPFVNFSQVYNYKPRSKLVEIGITGEISLIGEEELYTPELLRQANAQVCSENAVMYAIGLDLLENDILEGKKAYATFLSNLFENQTRKKILYRQEKLSEMLMCQSKIHMDYFYLEDSDDVPATAKLTASPRRYHINRVNQMISPTKSDRTKEKTSQQAMYNTFNFNKFPSNAPSQRRKHKPVYSELSKDEEKILELIHTVKPVSPGKKERSASPSRRSYKKVTPIDINNPLFTLDYFGRAHREAIRQIRQRKDRAITATCRSEKRSIDRSLVRSSLTHSGLY